MTTYPFKIKLAFISGLKEVVLEEVKSKTNLKLLKQGEDWLQIEFTPNLSLLKSFRSILRAYIIVEDQKYNPSYISRHKSVIGNIIDLIISNQIGEFTTFKLICAGSGSPEVRAIATYIEENFNLTEVNDDADLKIHITKTDKLWEAGAQITSMPLSVRDYKVKNMGGAMDPTIAYALNSLCYLDKAKSYLNVFSGSATLLIEASQHYPNLKKIIGFDNDKSHLSLAIQNIKQAGLIGKIDQKEADIFDLPDLGKFDVIVSDLPFGMLISKHHDLDKLYEYFVEYCQESLNRGGVIGIYTQNYEILKKIINKSELKIIKELDLKIISSINIYLYPKIFICVLK